MHKVAPLIEEKIEIPILHIADATAQVLVEDEIKKIGLLGTAFTMEQDFYKNRLIENFDLEVEVPNSEDRQIVHKIIYEELCLGLIKDESKKEYLRIIEQLTKNGCEAIILGCTEIALLVKQEDTKTPLYDTAYLHGKAAVKEALKNS